METQSGYNDIENRFDCACKDVVAKLSEVYRSDYRSAGPERLMAFFDLMQKEFDAVESAFIRENNLSDPNELHSVRAIAKFYAKKCVEDYSKIASHN